MNSEKVYIDKYYWTILLTEDKELVFYYNEVFKEEDGGFCKFDGEPTEYIVPTTADGILPPDVSAIRVLRKLLTEIVKYVNRSHTDFFYFTPSTTRKADFYFSIFEKYIPYLKGEWSYQMIGKKWYYFTRISRGD
jgi:hypothetical protein